MLAVMFSGRHELKTDEDGAYFIDRDGTHFRHILNFLRDPKGLEGTLPESRRELLELLKEADYYQLTQLVMHIKRIMMPVIAQETIDRYLQTRTEKSFVTDKPGQPRQPRQEDIFVPHWQDRATSSRRTRKAFSYEECNLSGLDFSKTAFIHPGISFRRSCLQNTNFSSCRFRCEVDFSDSDLSGANFTSCGGLISGGVNFKGANLDNTKFDDGVREKLAL